jgi:hypothetical protein
MYTSFTQQTENKGEFEIIIFLKQNMRRPFCDMFETGLKEINFKKYKQKKNQFYSVHVVLGQKVWAVKLFQEESSF